MSEGTLPTRGHWGASNEINALAAGIQEALTLGKGH
jgi:hypothetical protein